MSKITNQHVDDPGRQCKGKVGYDSKSRAKRTLSRRTAVKGRDEIKPYRCLHCGFWHLGHRR